MINIKFINATSVQLKDQNDNVVTTIGEFSGSPIEYTYSGNTFSKSPANYYHFVIEGTNVQLSGTIGDVTEDYQYWNLFKGQTAIVDASNLTLSSTTAKQFCYANMFKDCTNLISSPTISATTLDDWCYQGMFAGCRSLTSAPALIATILAPYCYFAMFYGCSSLITPPNLPAQTLTDWCYGSMFFNCSSLTSISSNFTSWNSDGNSTKYWVTGIETNGMFYNDNVGVIFGDNYVPNNWKSIYFDMPLTFKALQSDTNIGINKENLSYNKNNTGWVEYTANQKINLVKGDTIAFSGTNQIISTNFKAEWGGFQVYGNPHSLINWGPITSSAFELLLAFETFNGQTSDGVIDASNLVLSDMDLAPQCYKGMFWGQYRLTGAPSLPATGLAIGCYESMFRECSNLSTAPNLPATTLCGNCYNAMFRTCTRLSAAPTLPATTMAPACYMDMFYSCRNLSSVPNNYLPALNLAGYCYQNMFYYCTRLTSAPELPAETLYNYCYYGMFNYCSSLILAPILSSTTLAQNCYQYMFANCTSLTSAPELPATNMEYYCYADMFNGCTNLVDINVNFTNWIKQGINEPVTRFWVNGVAPTGTFTCPTDLDTTTQDISHVPVGWTVVNK